MRQSLLTVLLLASALCSCNRQAPELEFVPGEGGVAEVPPQLFDTWAKQVYRSDDAAARAALDEAYSLADSLSMGEDPPKTLETFAAGVADRFFSLKSPLYNEHIYELALDRERECKAWNSWGLRASEWRRALLNLNRAGTTVNDFWLASAGEAQDTLLRALLGGAPRTVLFIYGESCKACDELMRSISLSNGFKRLAGDGKVQFVSLYTGEDNMEFAEKSSRLPEYWSNWYDRENAVMYGRAFDTRMIPSMYVIDGKGTVLLRGERTVKKIISFLRKK